MIQSSAIYLQIASFDALVLPFLRNETELKCLGKIC